MASKPQHGKIKVLNNIVAGIVCVTAYTSEQVLFKSDKGTSLLLSGLLNTLPYNSIRTIKRLYFNCMLLLPVTTIGVLQRTITTTRGNRTSTMATRTIHPVK